MKKTLLFILFPILSFGQTQIGTGIYGTYNDARLGKSFSLSSNGNILAVGDYNYGTWLGTVLIYQNTGGTWTQFGDKFSNGDGADQKGLSVSLSDDGTIIAVGSPEGAGNGSEKGFVQVYQNKAGIWTQIGTNIQGKLSGEYFGSTVSLSSDGTTVAIGARGNSQNNFHAGAVRVYKNIAGTWTKIGEELNGKASGDEFGSKLFLSSDGSTLGIGTYDKYVSIYKNTDGNWTLLGNEIKDNFSGFSLSSDGSTVALSSSFSEFFYNGSFYETKITSYIKIMSLIDNIWTQIGTNIYGKNSKDGVGGPISLSRNGSVVAFKASGTDESGTVRIYQKSNDNWTQLGIDIKGEKLYDDNGARIVLSADGTTIATGSPSNNNNAGSVRVFNLSPFLNTSNFVMSQFLVYPNPTSEIVNISLGESIVLEKVNIYNTLGQLIKTEKSNTISVNALSKGIYYFEIITDKGKATKTVLVN